MPQQPGPRPRWSVAARVAAASILINIFLLAAIAPAAWERWTFADENRTPLEQGLSRVEHSLSSADARTFRTMMEERRPAFAKQARALQQSRADLAKAITAEPFDEAAVSAALQQWQASFEAFGDAFAKVLPPVLGAVSPEGRRRMVSSARGRTVLGP